MADEISDATQEVTAAVDNPKTNTTMLIAQNEESVAAETLLAREWSRQWDDATNKFFYTDATSGESTWEAPLGIYPVEGDDSREAGVTAIGGSSEAEGDTATGVWIAQYDPTAVRVYYYHTATGASQWEVPEGFEDEKHRDTKMDGAVRIQSAFRSKKARNRVKRLAGANAQRQWRQHFDPRSQQYYYANIETGEVTWDKPAGDRDLLAETDSQGDSATKIQCAFRKRAASKCVEDKKQLVRDLTSDTIINQKLQDIKRAVDEIDRDVEARTATLESSTESPQLHESLQSWCASATRIRGRVLEHHHHALLVQQQEATGAERLATAQQLHDAMAATRSECLALLKGILHTDAHFMELDVLRVNAAFQQYVSYTADATFSIPESKIRVVIRIDELEVVRARAEKCLRKAMGITDFSSGATTSRFKEYGEWRAKAHVAVESVGQLERTMQHKRDLLALYEQGLVERQETDSLTREDHLSQKCEQVLRNADQERIAHARFLALCRERWQRGLQKREEDDVASQRTAQALQAKVLEENQRLDRVKKEYTHARTRIKFSIWEAAREGCSVETMRGMIFAEMQKARQNGFDFNVGTARSSSGETLVQIACWSGHTELVSFLLLEGANVRDIDSISNGFTLLHDAARRGDAATTRRLVDHGLEQDVVDRSGDTPLHWAVRRNHYETVRTLLGVDIHIHKPEATNNDCALRAIRTRNNRGRKPIDLAKSECIRRLLQAVDEGRRCGPQFRNRLSGREAVLPRDGRRMTGTRPDKSETRNANASGLCDTGTTMSHSLLTKASTTTSLSKTSKSDELHHETHERDKLGVLDVASLLRDGR